MMLGDVVPDPYTITTWSQFVLCLAGAVALLVWALKQLLQSMTSSYGTVVTHQLSEISRLTAAGAKKEEQIGQLQQDVGKCKEQHAEAQRRHAECEQNNKAMTEKLNAIKLRVDLIERKNGGVIHESSGGGGREGDPRVPVRAGAADGPPAAAGGDGA